MAVWVTSDKARHVAIVAAILATRNDYPPFTPAEAVESALKLIKAAEDATPLEEEE